MTSLARSSPIYAGAAGNPQNNGCIDAEVDGGPEYAPGDKEPVSVGRKILNGFRRSFQATGGTLEIAVINGKKLAMPIGSQ